MEDSPESAIYQVPVTYIRRQDNRDGTFYAWLASDPDIELEQRVLYGPWHLRDKQGNRVAGVVKWVKLAQGRSQYEVLVLGDQEMVDKLGEFRETHMLYVGRME